MAILILIYQINVFFRVNKSSRFTHNHNCRHKSKIDWRIMHTLIDTQYFKWLNWCYCFLLLPIWQKCEVRSVKPTLHIMLHWFNLYSLCDKNWFKLCWTKRMNNESYQEVQWFPLSRTFPSSTKFSPDILLVEILLNMENKFPWLQQHCEIFQFN